MKSQKRPTNLLTNIVLVLPLLIFYEIGVLFSQNLNGADLFTRALINLSGTRNFFYIQIALLLFLFLLVSVLRRKQIFYWKHFFPVIIESSVYALSMGIIIGFILVELFGIDPQLYIYLVYIYLVNIFPLKSIPSKFIQVGGGSSPTLFEGLVMSAGAGVHEELIFRLFLINTMLFVGDKFLNFKHWLNLSIAILVSSILFSLAHHVGIMGEEFKLGVFLFRALAGAFFALLFKYRGFAIAVYTHTIYDVYVFIFATT